MTTSALPQPTEWMWEVQRLVVAEGRSTHAVADLLGLAQESVCQIIEQCVLWLAEVLPEKNARVPKEVRQEMAEQIAATRLDHLHGEAMRAWRASQGETYQQQQRRRGGSDVVEATTIRREQGNVRYLAAAMQIAIKMSKLPFALIPLASLKHSPDLEFPPVRDCSAPASEQAAEAMATLPDDHATDSAATACATSSGQERVANEPQLSVFTPVQPDLSAVLSRAAPEPPTGPPRNRHDRRARQKLLEQHLRQAK